MSPASWSTPAIEAKQRAVYEGWRRIRALRGERVSANDASSMSFCIEVALLAQCGPLVRVTPRLVRDR